MKTAMNYSKKIANFIEKLNYQDIPKETVQKAKYCFIDWLGAVYAAYKSPLAKKYIDFARNLGNEGKHLIIGSSHTTSLPCSIFANAALGHIAEVDDGHRVSIVHPGAVVMPVVFVLSMEKKLIGKEILTSIVTGYDIAIRVGECLGDQHYTIWHTTATAGTFGATAAAAKIYNLKREEIVNALGHAGTQAAGLWQFLLDGAVDAKAFHPAKAALNGFLAVKFAQYGFKGAERIFEGEKGLCKATSPSYDLNKLDDRLGELFKIDESNFKFYPTCGQTHTAIDALKKIIKENKINYRSIEKIDVFIYQKAIDIAGIKYPKSIEEAKFSIPFCLAAILVKGDITFDNLYNKDLRNPEIVKLMDKVQLHFDRKLDKRFPKCRPCQIKIILRKGKELFVSNDYRKGDPENPLNEKEIIQKFNQLTDTILKKSKSQSIIKNILQLEEINNFSEIKELFYRNV